MPVVRHARDTLAMRAMGDTSPLPCPAGPNMPRRWEGSPVPEPSPTADEYPCAPREQSPKEHVTMRAETATLMPEALWLQGALNRPYAEQQPREPPADSDASSLAGPPSVESSVPGKEATLLPRFLYFQEAGFDACDVGPMAESEPEPRAAPILQPSETHSFRGSPRVGKKKTKSVSFSMDLEDSVEPSREGEAGDSPVMSLARRRKDMLTQLPRRGTFLDAALRQIWNEEEDELSPLCALSSTTGVSADGRAVEAIPAVIDSSPKLDSAPLKLIRHQVGLKACTLQMSVESPCLRATSGGVACGGREPVAWLRACLC